MKIKWKHALALSALVVGLLCASVAARLGEPKPQAQVQPVKTEIKDGTAYAPTITVGPFDIQRKYRSMEGPWAVATFKIGDLISSGEGTIPETRVHYVEKENGSAPSMNSSASASSSEDLIGVVDKNDPYRPMYWFKGLKVEVIDENGKIMPTAEFICHTNLDFSLADHNANFPYGERWNSDRLITITQGQTNIMFPEGYGVPLAADEKFRVTFQAANRTSSAHRHLKHKATFYFLKDSELKRPIKALYSRVPFASVVVDRNYADAQKQIQKHHPSCAIESFAVNAANNVTGGVYGDAYGRVVSGHWAVPPGVHTYACTVNDGDPSFSDHDRTMRFAWTHIHPCCTEVSILHCDNKTKQKMFTTHVKTDTTHGLELTDIELIKSKDGIVFPKDGHYQLEGTYNNTLPMALDSMICVGLYFDDNNFRKPQWANSASAQAADSTTGYPLFDKTRDGPLLKNSKTVEILTSVGTIKLLLEPSAAPEAATQLYNLMKDGGFDGTPFVAYQQDYLLQLGCADDKAVGKPTMPDNLRCALRSLPVEKTSARHERWSLSLARQNDDFKSGSSSFCIMLKPAHHLDGSYSVFGKISPDKETVETIKRIIKQWPSDHAYILHCRV